MEDKLKAEIQKMVSESRLNKRLADWEPVSHIVDLITVIMEVVLLIARILKWKI